MLNYKAAFLFTAVLLLPLTAFAQVSEYPHVMDNGGGRISGGGYNNLASIGQAVSSTVSGTGLTNQAGFISSVVGATVGITEKENRIIPGVFSLAQNYPNPFNATTRVEFQIPENSSIEFRIFNVLGETVMQLNDQRSAGSYLITFETGELPSGLYFYSLCTEKHSQCRRMMILK
ncbi:T9SS type A sorting domain-containing protein [bacterium]|nr:T9SS type A sorting domain-containing protein [bacterium]